MARFANVAFSVAHFCMVLTKDFQGQPFSLNDVRRYL